MCRCVLLCVESWKFHENTGKQAKIDHIAIEIQLVISVGNYDFHNGDADNKDGNQLQVAISETASDKATAHNDRANEKPESPKTNWPQPHPDPVDGIMRNIQIIGV